MQVYAIQELSQYRFIHPVQVRLPATNSQRVRCSPPENSV